MSDLLHKAARARANNHFELFGLPVRYQLDRQLLSARYLELTRATHPDFAGTDADAQLQAMELSAHINEAHAVLDDDLRRAEYLLHLRGGSVGDRVSPELLERIFEMREALSVAMTSGDKSQAAAVRAQAANWLDQVVTEAGTHLDSNDNQRAQELLSAARYIRKIVIA
jgi:molecular chaperone HscB